jgi:photosystem II stability/assembly factor-like uncharacterized protein
MKSEVVPEVTEGRLGRLGSSSRIESSTARRCTNLGLLLQKGPTMRVIASLSLLFFCSCGPGDGGGEIGPGELGPGGGTARWVSVGQSGNVFYSDDGITWHQGVNDNPETLYSVSNDGHNFWVAVGINTAVYSSDSGETWTKSESPIVKELYGLANDGQGRWGAVGHNGAFYGSLDGGKTWTAPDDDKHFTTAGIRDVATDGTNWVAAGSDGHNGPVGGPLSTQVSSDGKDWQASSEPAPELLEDVDWNGQTMWVGVGVGGAVYRSTNNGDSWVVGQQLTDSASGGSASQYSVVWGK